MKVFLLLTLPSIQNHKKIIPRRIVYISLGLEFDEMPIAVLIPSLRHAYVKVVLIFLIQAFQDMILFCCCRNVMFEGHSAPHSWGFAVNAELREKWRWGHNFIILLQ